MSKLVKDHIDRCVEIYGVVGDEADGLRKASIDRASYEQMRTDLMVAIGMLSALHVDGQNEQIRPIKHPF